MSIFFKIMYVLANYIGTGKLQQNWNIATKQIKYLSTIIEMDYTAV